MSDKPIAVGCDHAAVEFKKEIVSWLSENGYSIDDCGTYDAACSVDYPDIAVTTCQKVNSGSSEVAILICGTGIGMSIAANKISGIRAALCDNCYSAKFTRLHNNANVLCLGARVISPEYAKMICEIFLKEEFEGGRHQRRIDKIDQIF